MTEESAQWLVSEIYPREEGVPLGVWSWADSIDVDVAGGSARVLKISRAGDSQLSKPIAFGLSYQTIDVSSDGTAVVITGARGLTGSSNTVVLQLPSDSKASSAVVNQQVFTGTPVDCQAAGFTCMSIDVSFAGSQSLRLNSMAGPPPAKQDSYEATITVTSEMHKQLQDRQAAYNISWNEGDLDASWLAPSRLLLYPYVTRPDASLADPLVRIDGKAVSVTRQYNSRGNHENVPAQGGAVSGNAARTFLGWFVDCTELQPDVPHSISLTFPWTEDSLAAHPFRGIYWNNIEDAFSTEVQASAHLIVI
jgi:hypothetical protein